MTDDQTLFFDLKGSVLEPDLVGELREYCETLPVDAGSLPPHARVLPGDPASKLIGHPEVMKIIGDGIEHGRERVRLESAHVSRRSADGHNAHIAPTPPFGRRTTCEHSR